MLFVGSFDSFKEAEDKFITSDPYPHYNFGEVYDSIDDTVKEIKPPMPEYQ